MLALAALPLAAHSGPPFPILENRVAGPVVIALWTDPDVGIGTFYAFVTPPAGGTIPDDLKIDIAVQPATGRLPETRYPMQREQVRGNVQFNAQVPFDAEELWKVRIFVRSAKGAGEASASVEVTPPGFGQWDLLFYASPFLAIGFIWFRVLLRRRKFRR